ncbi:ABC transporter substrate-binding protein [Leisingera sp. XS_AS12]
MPLTTDRRSLLIGASAFGAAAALGLPVSASTPKKGGELRLGIADFDSGDTLNPQLTESRFAMNLQWQLRNNLIEVGPGGVLQPELATEWESSADAQTWNFKLRKGVEFHNGKTLTAEDVIYSLNLHRGEDTVSEVKSLMKQITDITANGDHEITITLEAPNASLPSLMSVSNLTIVQAGETDFDAGIGTGGYILESFEPGVKSRVSRNPNYWKEGRAHFDAVELIAIRDVNARTTALQTGQIDAMNFVDPTTANLLKTLPGLDLIQTQGKVHYCFSMITTQAPFADVRVRKALKLAIDRNEMVEKVLGGFGSVANDQPISVAYQYHNPTIPKHEYDPDQARALIKAAGAEGEVLTLHASDTPFTGAVDAAQLFSEQAAKAGIKINVTREPDDGYWSNVWGKKPFFASRWSGRPNEDLMLTLAYSRESTWNATQWDNDAFNKALLAARGETDETKRKELYWECQRLLSEDGGLIAPVWADFLDVKSNKIAAGEISSDWDLDGARASERWWMA